MYPSEQRVPHRLPHCPNRRPRGHGRGNTGICAPDAHRASTPLPCWSAAITRWVYRGRAPSTDRTKTGKTVDSGNPPVRQHVSTCLHAGPSTAFARSWSALAAKIANDTAFAQITTCHMNKT
jgi:hypothetical protein